MLSTTLFVFMLGFGSNIAQLRSVRHQSRPSTEAVPESEQIQFSDLVSHPGDYAQAIINVFSNGPPVNISVSCATDISFLINGTQLEQEWALKFIDAAGKPGPGILQGDLLWMGSFGECQAITNVKNNASELYFDGQYCLTTLLPPTLPPNATKPTTGPPIVVQIGICVPSSCSEIDVTLLMSYGISKLPAPYDRLHVSGTSCQPGTILYDASSITILTVLALFSLLLIVATVYDIRIQHRPENIVTVTRITTVTGPPKNVNESFVETEDHDSTVPDEDEPLLGTEKNAEIIPLDNSAGTWCQLLLLFSLYTNGKKILDTSKQPDNALTCIHGIRFLSMTWVVLGHAYSIAEALLRDPLTLTPKVTGGFWFQAVVNATVSVDTFFVISGLLVSYLFVLGYEKTKKFHYLQFYIHRYWRLTPVYAVVMVVYLFLFKHFSSGPNWVATGLAEPYCSESWWTNLLYINNLCMGWTWYLGNDMQFYWISPLILLPLVRWPRIGFAVLGAFFSVHIIVTAVICAEYNISPSLLGYSAFHPLNETESDQYAYYYYSMPWTRIGPYLIGIFFGYILAKYRKEKTIKIQTGLVVIFWLMAIITGLSVVYGLLEQFSSATELSLPVATLYNVLHRNVWALAVCWVIFACVQGYGGFVNTLLSWNVFVPLSRLTYCCYLIHFPILFMYQKSHSTTFDFSQLEVVYFFFGTLVVTYGFAFVFSIGCEAPLLGLEKFILKRFERSKK